MSDDEDRSIEDQIEDDVRRLEEHSKHTGSLRKNIVDKLAKTVDTMIIDPANDKASALEAKMGIINTLLGAIKDSDDQKINLIKLKQRVKADNITEDSVKMISNTVTEFMRRIDLKVNITSPSNNEVTPDAADKALDESVANHDIKVLPGELEFTTKTAQDIKLD